MSMPRRLAPLLAVLAVLAPAGVRAEEGEDATADPVLEAPTMELLDAGKPPLERIRYAPRAGSTWDILHVLEAKQEVAIGGSIVQKVDTTYRATGKLSIDTVVQGAPTTVTFRVEKITVEMAKPGSEEVAGAMALFSEETLALLEGRTVHASFDDRGIIRSLETDSFDDLPASLAEVARSVTTYVREVVVPLPPEPIGAGARWRVTRTETAMGFSVRGQQEYTLVRREGPRLETRLLTSVSGEPQDLTSIAGIELPPGAHAHLDEFQSGASEGTATLFLDGLGSATRGASNLRLGVSMTMMGAVRKLTMKSEGAARSEFAPAAAEVPAR